MTTDPRGLAFRSPLSDVSATCLDPASCRKPAAAPRGAWESGAPRQLQERGLVNAGSFLVSPKHAAGGGRVDGGWTEAAVPGLPGARGQGAGQPRGPPMQRTRSRLAVFQAASPRPTRPHLMHALFRATSCVYDIGIHIRPPTRCPRRLRDSRKPRLLPARPPAHPGVPEGAGTGMTGSQGATRLLDK